MTEKNIILSEEELLKHNKILDKICSQKIFTPDQCAEIINTAMNTWDERESTVWNEKDQDQIVDIDYRNTTLFIPPPPKPDDWLFGTILSHIKNFNNSKDGYHFDISGMVEPPKMMRYSAPDVNPNGKPGKSDWHMDIGESPVQSIRKLSYSILLNAGDYEGGELAFHIGRSMEPLAGYTSSDAVGDMIIFPSYLVHRVLEVTRGIRYALVGWVHGNSFR